MGKSLVGVTYALFEDKRTVYLTATRGLQDQLSSDFGEVGLKDARGMSNYPCVAEGGDCSTASCTEGISCHLKAGGCHYFDAVRRFQSSRFGTTNYAFWFARKASNQVEEKAAEILICDEAHLIAEEMDGYLSVLIKDRDVLLGPGADARGMGDWRTWAKGELERLDSTPRPFNKWEKKRRRELKEKLTRLTRAKDDWVYERVKEGWSFSPLWPTPYLEPWLWRGAAKIILMSATVRPKTLHYLGLDEEKAHYVEYDSPIPIGRRPVYYIPAARITYRADDVDLWKWVTAMDGIIGARLDRKGIIHAVSYERARFIKENSRYGELMVIHDSTTAREEIARFKEAEAPRVLVSPSVTTGYDFPYDAARYQIIAKVPFQPPSALLKARTAEDKDYPYYLALTTIVQMSGRVCRGPDDVGETFIVDEMFSWLLRQYGGFTPRWFRKAVLRRSAPPTPPRLVGRMK